MAKITVQFQEPTDEYDASNQRQIKFKLEEVKTQLNTSYQRTIENDTQAFQWFIASYG
jgi:formiminotetrahydrofolate cyclodeaminase